MKKIMILLTLFAIFLSSCTTECPKLAVDLYSCEFGTYTKQVNDCEIKDCRPSPDFGCDDLRDGDSYYDGCNICNCFKGRELCTKKACKEMKQEGEMCGGIAGFMCEPGLTCILDGNYPDASGVCTREDSVLERDKITPEKYEVDYSCDIDSDCAVKNVGNCCGYFPECVNKDSPTYPEKVKEDCGEKGLASICGFSEIDSCACVDNVCVANN